MSQVDDNTTRRDLLFYAAGGTAAVAGGALVVAPAVTQMSASADVRALSKIQVDISGLTEGGQMVVEWQLKPVFIRYRTPQEIADARADDAKLSELRDQTSENANKPGEDASDINRTIDEEGKYVVAVALCTHLGCVPTVHAGDFEGWFCPCHGSHYDSAGRIRKGPAPRNLAIPPVTMVSDTIIEIGV